MQLSTRHLVKDSQTPQYISKWTPKLLKPETLSDMFFYLTAKIEFISKGWQIYPQHTSQTPSTFLHAPLPPSGYHDFWPGLSQLARVPFSFFFTPQPEWIILFPCLQTLSCFPLNSIQNQAPYTAHEAEYYRPRMSARWALGPSSCSSLRSSSCPS